MEDSEEKLFVESAMRRAESDIKNGD